MACIADEHTNRMGLESAAQHSDIDKGGALRLRGQTQSGWAGLRRAKSDDDLTGLG